MKFGNLGFLILLTDKWQTYRRDRHNTSRTHCRGEVIINPFVGVILPQIRLLLTTAPLMNYIYLLTMNAGENIINESVF